MQFAAAWFGSADAEYREPGGSGGGGFERDYFPSVAGLSACQWPEGMVTCRVLEAGARLGMLTLHVELNKSNQVVNYLTGERIKDSYDHRPPLPVNATESPLWCDSSEIEKRAQPGWRPYPDDARDIAARAGLI